ncbi:CaiB/BaiF CoA transferase family protein [Actinopolymorpha pittospori]|uniref:Crotonobetainyl-CoA:carnitine CoA-transferase CaiB-like acyl-CoA transferase n=1 Tax=Actinopolymorpha pittospori TaxID=648752 RepID=A0A927MUJ6_9ACTN|nr:CoA transferase [Actinopolymorpha pittospori]MBE1607146.1 crotonobetainyl-CoA:carnitine CoA-transferase CaiB-like acyl-CoA transferase [Actinopolymorpha pittospori]
MLDGVCVLSFTHYLQGPSAAQLLGDLGADVIKIERPQGAWERGWSGARCYLDGVSVFYLAAGRNQRSLAVDLRSQEGRDVVRDLARGADVVIENYRPGVMDRLGLGYDVLRQDNPALVYCSLTGYGSSGPKRDAPGQDMLVQAMSGLAQLSGRAGDPPTPTGTSVVDQHGAVLGALGVLAALFRARQTGEGTYVRGNLLDSALDLQVESLAYHLNGERLWDRSAAGVATRFHPAPYGVLATSDGYVAVSFVTAEQLRAVFEYARFEGLDGEDPDDRETITALVADHVAKDTTEHWLAVFDERGIWSAPVNDYRAVEDDPQVRHNQSIVEFEHPQAGTVRLVGHPLSYDGERPGVRRPPPQLGQDGLDILREIGRGEEDVRRLLEDGVIVVPTKEVSTS